MGEAITRKAALGALAMAGAALALSACGGREPGSREPGEPPSETVMDQPSTAPAKEPSVADETLRGMTLEQKAAQLLFVTPEQLTGVGTAVQAGERTARALAELPVGGIVYFSQNITGEQQLRDLLANTVSASREAGAGVPVLTGVDEEGGALVARVANSGVVSVEHFSDMADVGASGDPTHAARVGTGIGSYLHDLGFTLDFAPVADVLTNPENTVIGARSFGSDPQLVADMVAAEVEALAQTDTLACAKHFPGHGDTAGDSHAGEVTATRTREQLESCELVPFRAAIDAGCPFVMVGHILTPNVTTDGLPASLSSQMIGDVLRGELDFDGVVISDSFRMGAITQRFGSAEAAVTFLRAGGDMVLMPEDLPAAYRGILDAVKDGSLTEARLDESVRRVLSAKASAGLLP